MVLLLPGAERRDSCNLTFKLFLMSVCSVKTIKQMRTDLNFFFTLQSDDDDEDISLRIGGTFLSEARTPCMPA